jgi:hypothetical protein
MYLIWIQTCDSSSKFAARNFEKLLCFPLTTENQFSPKPQPPACFPFLFNYEPTEQLQPFEPLGSPLDPLSFRPQPLVQSPSLPPGYLATPPPITTVAGHHTPSSPLLKNDCHTSSPPPFTPENGAHPTPHLSKLSVH